MHYDIDCDTVITGTIKVFILYLIRQKKILRPNYMLDFLKTSIC